ncbi:MAG TPA: hypothetical protein VG754_11030 [Verrucomicrobiae bacterium]|nr:hypothetical protein [Verrucomicrobiae bacterium]
MSYLTLEVEIDHGKVITKKPAKLPEKASGSLTILEPANQPGGSLTPLQAFEELQKHLQLDPQKAQEWMDAVREGRR